MRLMRPILRLSVAPRFLVTTAALAALTAGCGPTIDDAAKADIDRRLAGLASQSQSFAAPGGFYPQPFQVGQWTQHKLLDAEQRPSFLTYKVVGQEGDAFWIEAVHDTYFGRTITKMLLAIPDRMNPASIDIRGVVTKDRNGHVQQLQGPMLAMLGNLYKSAVSMLIISWQGQPQEDAAVVAGRFTSCFKLQTDAQWGPWRAASLSWSHPAVPLSGLVRSQGLDRPTSMELVAFGQTGAVSEL
jgi:hypothetical protein